MEFYGPFREVEIGSDFLVGQTLGNTGENFFFPTGETHLAMNGFPGLQQLIGLLQEVFQNVVFGLN